MILAIDGVQNGSESDRKGGNHRVSDAISLGTGREEPGTYIYTQWQVWTTNWSVVYETAVFTSSIDW